VKRFQAGGVPLFLISLKAGGTGLNLTAADTIIHYDPWWNPAVEAQATDRAHRIGQDKPVFVYKLIAQRTVEEKIMQLQADKHALVNQLYTENSASPSQLSSADLEALFAP
jgi:SNF2 family DNA or RNA helicase